MHGPKASFARHLSAAVRRLRLVTCRTFETPAANTIPLFAQETEYVTEVYGREALELALPREQPQERSSICCDRPEHYASIVRRIRRHLRAEHSYPERLQELIEIVES